MQHRYTRWIVAIGVGLVVSLYSFQRISDPEPALQRAREEAVVMSARDIVSSYVAPGRIIELVDPLAPNRKVGKVYIYPTDAGWEVSGHYRRDESDTWHPYLMNLNAEVELLSLAVKDGDERLIGMSAQDKRFSAVP